VQITVGRQTDRQTDTPHTAFVVCFLKNDNFKQPGVFSFFNLELPSPLIFYNFKQWKCASSYCSDSDSDSESDGDCDSDW